MAGASTYVMGPGTLTFGETGSEQEVSCQITTGTVTWDTDQEDDTPVLCGDVEPGAVTFTAALEATLYQDISAEGVVEWSWSNKGSTVPVEFVPSTAKARKITGSIQVRPIDVGGDVKAKPTSDIEWPFVGEPTLDDVQE